jgi:hypothetical protein
MQDMGWCEASVRITTVAFDLGFGLADIIA